MQASPIAANPAGACGWLLSISLHKVAGLLVFASLSFVPWASCTSNKQAPGAKSVSRDCKSGYDDSLGKKKGTPTKRKRSSYDSQVFQSCVEVRDSAISIQEYLQSVVRELRWNIGEEQASEELWSFAMYLGPDDIATFTRPPADPKMNWTGGKAVVNVRTSELSDGYTRVIVKVKFDGFGEPEDKFAPQRSTWPLPSSGALETRLTDSARNRASTGH